MKWKKLGKIFDPTHYSLINGCKEFAQSPQILEFDDFVRIYFSTRQKDESNGKYLSHIAFVDMTKDFKYVIKISSKNVVELGRLGTFDEHGIFPVNIVRDSERILAYTCGWSRRVSVSVETSIGLAISNDLGVTFKKINDGPIMSASLNEPFLVGDAFVCKFQDKWHMWYIFGTKWMDNLVEETARVYKIGHAISEDGISWVRNSKQIISDVLNADECQALPTVIFTEGKYHMYFCYREATGFRKNKERGYRIGYAYSADLNHWTRADDNCGLKISEDGWDSEMMCYPHVFHLDGSIYMLYNGNEFGKYGFGLALLEN